MRTARWALILPVFGLVLVLAGCAETMQAAAPSDKTVIRIGSPFKPGHILVDAAPKFKELAESRSGGRLAVQIDAGTLSEEEINKIFLPQAFELKTIRDKIKAEMFIF